MARGRKRNNDKLGSKPVSLIEEGGEDLVDTHFGQQLLPGQGAPEAASGNPYDQFDMSASEIEVDIGGGGTTSSTMDDGTNITWLPGGEIEVDLGGGGGSLADAAQEIGSPDDHGANLALHLTETDLNKIAADLIEYVDADVQSMAPWRRRLAAGLAVLGLTDTTDGGLPFPGASTVTHPLAAESIVQFNARAMPELMPPGGPVKGMVLGEKTEQKEDKALRVEQHMNYQITVEDEGNYEEMDQLLFYLPMAGQAFKKTYFDEELQYTTSKFVRGEDVIMPYTATSFEDSPRFSHKFMLHTDQIKVRMKSGLYRTIDISSPVDETVSSNIIVNNTQNLYDKADGKERHMAYTDPRHELYEVYLKYDLPQPFADPDGIARHYIITLDYSAQKVLSIYRNWRKGDTLKRRRKYFAPYKYFPGTGCHGWGMFHIIGGLAEACTGSVRALLDSASFATLQGGFKSKDARMSGDSIVLKPGEWQDVDLTAEELSKAFYTPPFKEPSRALFELLSILEDNGRRFAGTTEAVVGDAPSNGPVGTTVAMIEQGTKVMTGIHRRLHRAQAKEFRIRAEINAEFLPDSPITFSYGGKSMQITRAEYADAGVDVVPVSDPNIVSSAQRIAIAQSVVQLANEHPDIYNKVKAHERMLRSLGVDQPQDILITEEEIPRADAVCEGSRMLAGKKIKAFADQNHDAHQAIHMAQIEYYKTLPDAQIAQKLTMDMIEHYARHEAYRLYNLTQQAMGVKLPEVDLYAEDSGASMPPELENEVSDLAARMINNIMEFYQQRQAPPPEDAKTAAEIKRKDVAAAADEKRKQLEFEADESRKDAAFANEQKRREIGGAQEGERREADAEQSRKLKAKDAEAKQAAGKGGKGDKKAAPAGDKGEGEGEGEAIDTKQIVEVLGQIVKKVTDIEQRQNQMMQAMGGAAPAAAADPAAQQQPPAGA